MSDAQPTTHTASPAGPQDQPATRSAGLLGLLSRLLDYGRDLLAELQQRNTPDPPPAIAHRFGAVSLALIVARITRGIMLATALHDRVTRNRRTLDAREPRQARPSAPSSGAARPPRPIPQPEDEAAELANLPSAQEIAERIRHRRIGAVITEICRDLGINGTHELWGEVLMAITCNGGNRAALFPIAIQRGINADALGFDRSPPLAEMLLAMTWNDPPARATPPP